MEKNKIKMKNKIDKLLQRKNKNSSLNNISLIPQEAKLEENI